MAGVDAARFACAVPGTAGPSYSDGKYWKLRYTEKTFEPFEWYLKWEQIKEIVAPLLTAESEVLVLGCGTSLLPEQLLAEGLAAQVTCVDQCAELIEALKQKYADKAGLQFEHLSAQQLPQDWAQRFDLVLDKAMLDCVLSGRQARPRADEILQAVSAVLKSSGSRYVLVSHARPEQRLHILCQPSTDFSQEYQWTVSRHKVPRPLAAGDAAAKGGKAKKGDDGLGGTLEASAACNPEENAYHIYCCERE
eukprot:CAMPEP_0197655108 /NCGR_PEP_ID=MMETSP1338-20131121/39253_1 /TAXON_ID=43686 ORGANISM="Pelagodinium beii, Strain RCC1491" /NCGR_SAMPLE_ID=MMETSP1338 /ASSEMBLY_ACC=CAM_ASM_000754 /LENGTH=249 /DNA_ID=CAMNT_0043230687 /DNA_START=47 /DNA_END=796 /DNA_ORIENTATION=+